MSEQILRERVYSLAMRFPGLGIGADICAFSFAELRGVYRFLTRLNSGGW